MLFFHQEWRLEELLSWLNKFFFIYFSELSPIELIILFWSPWDYEPDSCDSDNPLLKSHLFLMNLIDLQRWRSKDRCRWCRRNRGQVLTRKAGAAGSQARIQGRLCTPLISCNFDFTVSVISGRGANVISWIDISRHLNLASKLGLEFLL